MVVAVKTHEPLGELDLDKGEFDEMLRTSKFFATNLFDAIKGVSVLINSLAELLVETDKLSMGEVRDMFRTAAADFADRPAEHLARFVVDAALRDFELYAETEIPHAMRELRRKRRQEDKDESSR
jgi:hypothetical protein